MDPLPALPALKSLGRLSELRPCVVIDTREQTPLEFLRLPSQRGNLFSGDYSAVGLELLLAVERKTCGDFISCCMNSNRDRFEHELARLRGMKFRRLVIVGTRSEIEAGQYRSNITPKAALATLETFQIRYDIPVCFFPSPAEAAREIEQWVWYFAREIVMAANGLARDNGLTSVERAAPAV